MAQQSARRDRENQGFPPCFEHALGDLDPVRELPYRPAAARCRIRGRTDGSIRLRAHDPEVFPCPEGGVHRWGTDLTTTITGEGPAAVFVAVDHCSVDCVGIHAAPRATRFEALEPIRQGVRDHFGGFAGNIANGLGPARPWIAIHVRCLPEGARVPRRRSFSRLRPCARRQWLRRTVHPHAEGEPVVGADSSIRSRISDKRCSRSAKPTMRPGSSSGTDSSRPQHSGENSFNPRPSPLRA